jgi:hypothetical protein
MIEQTHFILRQGLKHSLQEETLSSKEGETICNKENDRDDGSKGA